VSPAPGGRRVLVTGAGGLVGRGLLRALSSDRTGIEALLALDVRPCPPEERLEGVVYRTLDVCSPELGRLLQAERIDTVVHLAAIVTPGPETTREMQRAVDVGGTENVLAACTAAGVRRLVVTSSGAAYGYHPDNPVPLHEEAPLRGNPEFAYSAHKRIVEELLARHRQEHPELAQLVLRLGTVLGRAAANQITALFEKPVVLGILGASTPFVFAWEDDVVACLALGIRGEKSGTYNLVGDGQLTLREIASLLGKPYLPLPAWLLAAALWLLRRLGRTRYGPEQVRFLRYRPVLANGRLKRELHVPAVDARGAFARYLAARGRRSVVITGAASGIGLALASRFARAGDRVALLDRDGPGLVRACAALRAAGGEVALHLCDVADGDQCRAAIGKVIAEAGGVDVLVNNAGISHRSLLLDTDPAVIRRVMEVNFLGAVHCTRAALPSLVRRRGMVVALSSVAGFAPLLGRTGYAASKHALHGFLGSLREELHGSGAGVLLACPAFVDTGIDAAALAGDGSPAGAGKPLVGRKASAEEVAQAIFGAVAARRRLLLFPGVSRSSYWLWRLWPGLYARTMRARLGSEFRRDPGQGGARPA